MCWMSRSKVDVLRLREVQRQPIDAVELKKMEETIDEKLSVNIKETMAKQVHVLKTVNVLQPSIRMLPDPSPAGNTEPNT